MRGVPRERAAISAMPSLCFAHAEDRRRALEDARQRRGVVEIQTVNMAEPIAQRRRQQARTGSGADQREALQIELDRSRRRALTDHDVDLIVFHRRIEHFLDDVIQAMNFVDEKHVALLEVGQQRGEIAGPLHHRPRSRPDVDAHFPGDDVGERGLAQSRRAMKQHMIEDVAAPARCRDRHPQIGLDLLLADVFVEAARP